MTAWRILTSSVRGATHERRDKPNQDAVDKHCSTNCVILALADGHGEAKCFRSARGAKIAVEKTVELLRQKFEKSDGSPSVNIIKEYLPREIVRTWRHAIKMHHDEAPFAEDHKCLLLDSEWRIAYGTTLLAAAAIPSGILFLQLGDGDILIVDSDNNVHSFPHDPRLIGNATLSLCDDKADTEFRVDWKDIPTIKLVLLATDGYRNSFRDDQGFQQAALDYALLIEQRGVDAVEQHIEEWLKETSRDGSGDDITVGILWCEDSLLTLENKDKFSDFEQEVAAIQPLSDSH